MKYFSEIIRILERFNERRVETMDNEFRARKESMEYRLYDGIRKGVFEDDFEAAESLYQTRPTAAKYMTLKSRLKVRMMNTLLHLNWKRAGFSESAQALYTAHKRAFTVHILIALGGDKIAKRIAERNLELATKYSLTEISLSMARQLRLMAGNAGKKKEYRVYNALTKDLLRSYSNELLSSEYLDQLIMIFNRQRGGRKKYAEELEKYYTDLEALLGGSSYAFQLNYYRIGVAASVASGVHSQTLERARQGLSFLDGSPHLLQRERKADFWYYQLQSYLGVHNFEQAEHAAEECDEYYNPGSNNWFAFSESKFLLYMNTFRFADAKELLRNVTSHERFALQSELWHEHWEIFTFYLNYALKTTPDYDPKTTPLKFNYELLERKVPHSRRDKEGMNVLLRIAQIIHCIETRDFNRIFDLYEGLVQYRNRYLTASMAEQSSLFIRLLGLMVRRSFSYKHCLREGAPIVHKLKTGTFEIIDLEQEVQVLPYVWLWEHLLEELKAASEARKPVLV